MPSIFWTTNGTGDGAAPYTQEQIIQWLRFTFLRNPATQGILPGVAEEFQPVVSGANVVVRSGAAYVYGFPFWETTSQTIPIPIPTVGPTGHRIVLRADWSQQTVRVRLKSSNNGDPTIPPLAQTPGAMWELSLATLTITTSGVITLTDTRSYCQFNTIIHGSQILADTISGDRLIPGTVQGNRLAAGTVTGDRLTAGTVTGDRLAPNSVNGDRLLANSVNGDRLIAGTVNGDRLIANSVNGNRLIANSVNGDRLIANSVNGDRLIANSVNGDRLVDASVSPTKLIMGSGSGLNADRLEGTDFFPFRRQGGTNSNNSNWTSGGSLNSDITTLRVQMGSAVVSVATFGSPSGPASITFPSAFANVPLVFVSVIRAIENPASSDNAYVARVASVSETGCTITAHTSNPSPPSSVTVVWLALGPA